MASQANSLEAWQSAFEIEERHPVQARFGLFVKLLPQGLSLFQAPASQAERRFFDRQLALFDLGEESCQMGFFLRNEFN